MVTAVPHMYPPGSSQPPPGSTSSFYKPLFAHREIDRVNQDTPIGNTGWKLALDLGVDLEYTDKYVIATNQTWIDEYGHGSTKQAAIDDLLVSLADFRESLEQQEQVSALADELVDALANLRILLVKVND